MAIITLGTNTLQARATVQGKVRSIYRSKGNISGKATVQAKVIRRLKTGATPSGAASTIAKASAVRYVKAGVLANATLSTKQFSLRKYVKANVKATAQATGKFTVFKTVSANINASATVTAYRTDRDNLYAMKDYLPKYYNDIQEAMRIIQTEANEITKIRAELSRVYDQFFVNSSDVTLDRWEKILDIDYTPNRSYGSRRHYINAKLRGAGTTTKEILASVVNSFYGATVTEKNGNSEVHIKITGKRGVPKNIPDIQDAVNDIVPAHILPTYGFSFVPWSEVQASDMRFEDANVYTWETLQKSYPQAPVTWSALEDTTQADTDIKQFSELDTRLEFD